MSDTISVVGSPDDHGAMLTRQALDPKRYDQHEKIDAAEATGIMNAMMPFNVRVLDVGSGPGSMTVLINMDRHNDIICLEPDRDRVEVSRTRGLDTQCGVLDEKFAENSGLFDVVTFADVLEHLPSPGSLLGTTFSILKPGGCVIASVPNVAHWSIRSNLFFGRFDYSESGLMDVTHLRWFTEKTFKELFERSGFIVEVVRQSAGVWLPQYQSSVFSILPGRVRRKLVIGATRLWPGLFGCQHVILARKPLI